MCHGLVTRFGRIQNGSLGKVGDMFRLIPYTCQRHCIGKCHMLRTCVYSNEVYLFYIFIYGNTDALK